ncbi:hypothetical protein JAAARDRAFT_118810, partial [Jaapia argillacea MUCL 33604]
TPNDMMREWKEKAPIFLHTLLSGGARPSDGCCHRCSQPGLSQCLQCFGHLLFCTECCRDAHMSHPFHWVEIWKDDHFSTSWLWQVGVCIHLGHGGGQCPGNTYLRTTTTSGDQVGLQLPEFLLYPGDDEERDGDEHEIWEDEEDDSVTELHHLLADAELTSPPSTKGNGRNFTIVDVSGIHEVVVHFCNCGKCQLEFLQLLDLLIYPGSIKCPRMGFTFQVLDNFHIHNLECKTNAWEYYQTIQQATKPWFPHLAQDRYREFMCVVCQWRYLKVMKWHSFGHGLARVIGPGDLVLWCAACLQPGINLPSDWKEDQKSYLYTRIINLDGNMKAEQMVQKPIDVPLAEGGGFMVGDQDYKASIKASIDDPLVFQGGTCHNHQAVTQGNMGLKNLQVTSIGAAACGRHGAFCPHSVVNFQKGERFTMNMDYAFTQSLLHTMGGADALCLVMSLYNINCQFAINLLRRIAQNQQYLPLAKGITIHHGIGLFHVHSHQDLCTPRYLPNYIPGAGQVDGEVIETLWSNLNWITSSCRAMWNNHRAETFDIHMNKNIRKKMLNISECHFRSWRMGG